MNNCAYLTKDNQCQHKNVFTNHQVVTPKICGICKFNCDTVDPKKLRSSLPILPENPDPTNPRFFDVAKNFATSVAKHGTNIVTGERAYVPEEVYAERMDTCSKCEYYNHGACKICTCNLARKCRWTKENCPIGKWVEYTEPETEGGQTTENSTQE